MLDSAGGEPHARAAQAPLSIARDGAIATIVLNRPSRANAIDVALGEALERALLDVASDPAVRAIVLTGAGGHFCAGGDIARLEEVIGDRGAHLAARDPILPQPQFARLGDAGRAYHSRYLLPAAIGKPVIAAIEGICSGVGLVLALACDLRVVAADARIAAGFGERGLVGESGVAHLLSRIGGAGLAARLLIACDRIDGSEAHRCHLAEHLAASGEARTDAEALARRIAEKVSPRSAAVIKRQIQYRYAPAVADALAHDFATMMDSFGNPDFAEGIASLRERRPPRFAPWQENDQ